LAALDSLKAELADLKAARDADAQAIADKVAADAAAVAEAAKVAADEDAVGSAIEALETANENEEAGEGTDCMATDAAPLPKSMAIAMLRAAKDEIALLPVADRKAAADAAITRLGLTRPASALGKIIDVTTKNAQAAMDKAAEDAKTAEALAGQSRESLIAEQEAAYAAAKGDK
jgi:hypothetical protein